MIPLQGLNQPPPKPELPPLLPTPKSPFPQYTSTKLNFPIRSQNIKLDFTKPISTRSPTKEENEARRRKGLCMWCGGKYTRDHNCMRSQLYQLLLEKPNDKLAEHEEFSDCIETMDEVVEDAAGVTNALVISLHALFGLEDSQTMRITSQIKHLTVMFLID